MRCAECGVETGQAARFCPVCGAPAAGRSPAAAGSAGSPAGDAADLAQWAHRAGSARFSRTRLRPGYDMEQVDAFVEAIRDTFLGVRQPPLTADEVRGKKFSTTRLQPGYDEKEVDDFLDEAEARLRMRCAECGALVAVATRACAECGAPPAGHRPAAAGH
jgi:DivIVA domain-containing protein